ncbi:MAG: hypothetical protein K2K09_04185 [Lachnospiraceae bacterium]|nr:hypothetical protein [Lachnospiraceae bacterium]
MIIVLLIRGLYICEENANMYVDTGIERNKADYMQLMDELSGVLTPEKQQMLADMEEKNNSISQEIADSGLRNFQGELADEEYWNICKKNVGFHSLRNKVDLIQAQADYVKEDMSKRYFMYENGWKQFFGNRNINYPLLFLLIISITAIFCRDYETDMYRINRTTANGDAVCYISKITAGIIVSVFTAWSFWLEDILTAHMRFGLNNPDYPLQSISMFKDSRFDMTIGNTALLCLLFSILGAAFFSVILMFAAILFRKNMYAIVVSLAVCVLPV